jgi:hypothetical protein
MKIVTRQAYLDSVKLHFGDETAAACGQNLGQAKSPGASLRQTIAAEQAKSVSSPPQLRFSSKGIETSLKTEKLAGT